MTEVVASPSESSSIPKYVLDQVGYEGWLKLSKLLQSQAIQKRKLELSAQAGYDVGVPATVESLLDDVIMIDPGYIPPFSSFRRLAIAGYLLGTDYKKPLWGTGRLTDQHADEQCGGDIKRWWNRVMQSGPREWGAPAPRKIIEDHESIRRTRLDSIIVSVYSQINDLGQFKPQIAARVGVIL